MPMPQISKSNDLLTAYLLEDNSTNVEVASLQEIDPNFFLIQLIILGVLWTRMDILQLSLLWEH